MERIGSFEVLSGQMVLCDPSDSLALAGVGLLGPVRVGTWEAHVLRQRIPGRGERVTMLEVRSNEGPNAGPWHRITGRIAIETGVAGFFDVAGFSNGSLFDVSVERLPSDPANYDSGDPFFDACCACADSVQQAGCLRRGAVAKAGLQDEGTFCAFVQQSEGVVFAAKVVFLDEGSLN